MLNTNSTIGKDLSVVFDTPTAYVHEANRVVRIYGDSIAIDLWKKTIFAPV